MRPITSTQLRFGCDGSHDTFANVVRDGRVMVALYAPPDVAVGIRGRARVLKEQIDSWPTDAVIQIEIEVVENDALPIAAIAGGITHDLPDEVAARLDSYIAEVQAG